MRKLVAGATLWMTVSLAGCGENPAATGGGGGGGGGGAVPSLDHVFVVVEENTNYADVIGNPDMPYLNGLAQQYALAEQYYANTHPSIGNYFMMTVGRVVSNDDGYSGLVSDDNIVRRLTAAGKTWKSYAEDLPSAGYTGSSSGDYARKHNVFALLSDVVNDASERQRLVPFTQLAADLASGSLPAYAMIVPNLCNDAHNCSLATADAWLRTNIDPLIKSPAFQRSGLLVITFDEAGSDDTHGGGRIATVLVGPSVKRGFQSATLYQHQNLLRLALDALRVTGLPNGAANAATMGEFFTP